MTRLPDAIRTVRWMVRDTFRQSLHTKLFWVMLGVTVLCTAFCASIRVTGDVAAPPDAPLLTVTRDEAKRLGEERLRDSGVQVKGGEISFGFGAVKSPVGKTREDSVRFVQLWMAGVVADSLGVLLALIWTAGFLPTFLEPHSASVLLAKPAPRWAILFGKYIGVVGFVALQAVLFVAGTGLATGLATGVWYGAYWLAVPLLVANFAIFYAVSAFVAVCTRSTVAAAFGTLLFWALSWGMNYTHHRLVAFPVEGMGPASYYLLEVGYWFLPKPLDLSGIFFGTMGGEGFYSKVDELSVLQNTGRFRPEASVAASAGFAAVTLGLAAYEFEMTDY
jgi:ABC-type transport system involved in multi-copper enzyme maturation permease subunit